MSSDDPERLSSLRTVPALREALRAARERVPDPDALAALRARVEAVAVSPSTSPSETRPWPLAAKLALPVIALVGLVAGIRGSGHDPEIRLREAPTVLGAAPVASIVLAPVPVVQATPAPAEPQRVRALPTPSSHPTPSVASSSENVAAETPSELDLIGRASRALKSDPTQALQLATEHARRYPEGALSEEREVIAIEALAHLGNRAAARARAERFMVSYTRSAHLSRVERAAGLNVTSADAADQKE